MYKRSLLLATLLCTMSAYAQIDTSKVLTGGQKKEPMRQSVDTGKLQAGLGPGIPQFEAIPGCAYPNPERDVLRYRVNNAPDGARVVRVTISDEYDSGDGTSLTGGNIFVTPATSTAGVRTAGTIPDSRVERQLLRNTAYVLQATDSKGRTSSRRIAHRYLDPNARLDYRRLASEPREIRRPEGTFFEYAYEVDVDNLAIRSITSPSSHNVRYNDGRGESVPVTGVTLYEQYSASGARRALRIPSRRFDLPTRLVLAYTVPVENYRNYRGRWYDRWSTSVTLALQHPPGCTTGQRSISAAIPAPSSRPATEPDRPAPPPSEPYVNAYRSEIFCACDDRYQRVLLTVQGCMLDQRAAGRVCYAAAQTLPSRAVACAAVPGAYRRISEEMDCNDAQPAPVITNIDDGSN
jgi:hypothetical protein